MRIILIHNPKAGRGKHTKRELVAGLENAGHDVIYRSTKKEAYEKVLEKPADLVIAAGGDGTVGKVGRHLVDSGVPLAVFPLGTANNLARNLGFVGAPQDIIAALKAGKPRPFDVGLARGPCGKRYFFESVGGGVLADYLASPKSKTKKTKKLSKEAEMKRHVSALRELLRDYPARECTIEVDGKDLSDRYILWEAMNIRSVGPVLYLASHAATRDGRLDFVCVRESDRSLLMEYLAARLTRGRIKFPLPFHRFQKAKTICKNSPFHFDSKVWPPKRGKPQGSAEVEIEIKPSALTILQLGEHH
jgi:diacylglycerol kinase family enzyme